MTVIETRRPAKPAASRDGTRHAEGVMSTLPADDLVSALQAHVRQRPDQVAVRFLADGESDARELNYAALDAGARRLAAVLRRHGAAGDRVLLMLPSGLDYVVSFFACQYAGMIAVPAYPPEAQHSAHVERLRRMTSDCAARIAVLDASSRAGLAAAVAGNGLGDAVLVDASARDVDPSAGFCVEHVDPQAIAFLQYTSGSTASPKGVMVGHANLCINVAVMAHAMDCRPGDRMFSWLPLYHDMGLIAGVLMPLLCGFPVTLVSPLHFLERPARWLTGVATERATHTGGPDFAFRLCAERVRDAQLDGLDLSSLRVAFCGSEPIRQATFESFVARFASHGLDPRVMYACYGLAEATLFVSGVKAGTGAAERRFSASALARPTPLALPSASDADAKAVVGCGGPAWAHTFAIVDPDTRARVPQGRVGEIWCSGPSVTQGYWHNAQATADTFLDDTPGFPGRWLRTGDLGFIDAGELFVCGRRKDMIVLRGENVYPQDLEAVLADRVESLRRGRIAAFPIEGAEGAEETEAIGVAAEVPRGRGRRIASERIFGAISSALGEAFGYEVGLILLLEPGDLPRTSSGKLQRSACFDAWRSAAIVPFAVHDARHRSRDAIAAKKPQDEPLTATARVIAEVWRDVLDIPLPGASDDFFLLGGRSLLALKVAARLRERFARDVPPGLLFAHTTPAALGFALDTRWSSPTGDVPAPAALARRSAGDAPLSLPQERLWVLWRLDPQSAAYNVPITLSFDGPPDIDATRAAIDALVRRHEALRTRFVEVSDVPRQQIVPAEQSASAWTWDVVDLDEAYSKQRGTLDAALYERTRTPFDLQRGPLVRATFLRCASQHVLHIVMHHIVVDGWSVDILLREFAAAYRAARRGETNVLAALPALPVQYADYASWQREHFAGEGRAVFDAQLDYWRTRLSGYDQPIDLPTDHERCAPYDPRAASTRVCIPPALTARLESLARAERATLFMVLLAAFYALLYRYSHARDIVVAVPVAGRDRVETDGLIGFFVNTLAMRASVKGSDSFVTLLRAVRDDSTQAQANAGVPFDRVVAAHGERREHASGLAAHPLAQIKFVLHDEFATSLDLDGVRGSLMQTDASTVEARFELALDVLRRGDEGLDCVFAYAAALYDEAFVAQFAQHYVALLDEVAAAPACAIAQFMLGEGKTEGEPNDAALNNEPAGAAQLAAGTYLH
ncbi:AMP-binding protein [Paraburkholderia sp. A1RI_3L]|uniref:condensation domain-containing protein n=1 Tax=Paraburkholderia TaxID=1822464 RepID=UPI003B781FCA